MEKISYIKTLRSDLAVAIGFFASWSIVASIVDASGAEAGVRQAASLTLSVLFVAINGWSLYSSFRLLGTPRERQKAPETVIGIFAEIIALAQTFGVCYLAARTWSLPDDDSFHNNTFLANAASSVFEMSFVQAGVGWTELVPKTFWEKLVAWLAALVGGVLITNLYLLTVITTQRGWWIPSDSERVGLGVQASDAAAVQPDSWKFESLRKG
tara:strand:- start:4774 stop:5409 length:636 start_codon:yes stop_codon:yes gene_type:complete